MAIAYRVDGMTCDGCARAVERAAKAAAPGCDVVVDRAAGSVSIDGEVAEATLRAAIERAGFGFAGPA
ncbi:MAG: heavy metal transporter [Alphaproteobacteria bacterium]|nr:heavy metal transporter [Alphaproteobacteria bacterium]MBM3627287.1 heavy metal transporter [Alphaproteobacteria bacterium]